MLSKILNTTVITLASLILFLVMSCSLMMDAVTPCYIPKELAKTIDEPLTSLMPYTSIFDAERILRKVEYLTGGLQLGLISARELQQNVFNPAGPLGLLLVGSPAFALGSFLVSKPKDKKIIEGLKNGTKSG